MAKIRGERFNIDLDDDDIGLPSASEDNAARPPITSFVADIQERGVSEANPPAPPTLKNGATGFPAHKSRTSKFKQQLAKTANDPAQSSTGRPVIDHSPMSRSPAISPGQSLGKEYFSPEDLAKDDIDKENQAKLAAMSTTEIEQERQELLSSLNPSLIEKLLKRSTIEDSSVDAHGWNTSYTDKKDEARKSPELKKRPSAGHQRRVSFAVPDQEEDSTTQRPTAGRHSISFNSTTSSTSPPMSRSPSKETKRPSPSHRKVSFAVEETDAQPEAEHKPTAGRHSICSSTDENTAPLSPPRKYSLNPIDASPYLQPLNPINNSPYIQPLSHSAEGETSSLPPLTEETSRDLSSLQDPTVHFPKPPPTDLDPSSATFLEDLHSKYFPSLPHDPSKLAWLQPLPSASDNSGPSASATGKYHPSNPSLSPRDIRFDFSGALLPPSVSQSLPTNLGLHNHGADPDAAGYTIPELGRLARSSFPAQRCMAMQTLGRVLYRLGSGEWGDESLLELPQVAPGGDGEQEGKEPEGGESKAVEGARLARGLWQCVEEARVVDTLVAEAGREKGHATSIAVAQEAVWLWRRGGGRKVKAV